MAKKEKIIAEGEFKIGISWDYTMLYTKEIDSAEMEDRLAALHGKKGKLIFVEKS
ncbi:MAG: hypothetical protein Q8N73_01310 [bacterium]|nr:hypothetical protein [bacterium]